VRFIPNLIKETIIIIYTYSLNYVLNILIVWKRMNLKHFKNLKRFKQSPTNACRKKQK